MVPCSNTLCSDVPALVLLCCCCCPLSSGNQPCSHGHSHSHDSSHSDSDSDHEAAHNHSHCDDEHGSHSHGEQAAAAAGAAGSSATAAGQECVVITVPGAAVSGGSGLACTISKTGSREIEVRCELPVPAAAAAAAQARPRSHSHAGQGHSQEHSHEHDSINLRGAVLHVIGDLLQSIGVAIAGGLIWLHQDDPRWYLADPICTFVFSIVVLLTTKSILRDIVHVLMERTPPNMDVPAVARVSVAALVAHHAACSCGWSCCYHRCCCTDHLHGACQPVHTVLGCVAMPLLLCYMHCHRLMARLVCCCCCCRR